MGCDIHAYIEYKKPEDAEWKLFGYHKFYLCPDYDIFSIMAGVRNCENYVQPRGIPEDVAWNVSRENVLYATDDKSLVGIGKYVDKEDANDWVVTGYSKKVGENRVTNPLWHSHSWLTLEEVKECLRRAKKALIKQEPPRLFDITYDCLVACMETIEKKEFITRLVFWFDN